MPVASSMFPVCRCGVGRRQVFSGHCISVIDLTIPSLKFKSLRLKERAVVRKRWIKLWTQETLYGTTKKELSLDERWVWPAFLALAGDSIIPGVICVAPGIPFTDQQLSDIIDVPMEILQSARGKMLEHGKISQNENGIIHIANWQRYQSEYDRTKGYKYSTQQTTPKSTTVSDVDNSVESLHQKVSPITEQNRTEDITDILRISGAFSALKLKGEKEENKVGFLMDVFKALHLKAPKDDLEELGGRMAGIMKSVSNDWIYVLTIIWNTTSTEIIGSHLNYIQGVIKKNVKPTTTHGGKLPKKYTEPEEFDAKYWEEYWAEHGGKPEGGTDKQV